MGLQIVIFLISIAASLALQIDHINQGAKYSETEFQLLPNPSVIRQYPSEIAAQTNYSDSSAATTAVAISSCYFLLPVTASL